MIYRESGQFKTNYKADQAILPIFQDKVAMALLMLFAFVVIPFIADDYWLSSILIPFLALSLAALGLNVLTGYAGQISLGTAAFMAVGAFAAYNLQVRVPEVPFLIAFVIVFLENLIKFFISLCFNLHPALKGLNFE